MPSYQSSAAGSLNVINGNSSGSPCGASTGGYCREVPDVSADADPYTGYLINWNGGWTGIGGTSAAAPLWAAFAALIDASSACAGTPIGFANPGLYAAAASAYASDFTDVTSGNNDYTPAGYTGGLYQAGAGYDMASGLGSPNGATLPAALCGAKSVPNTITLTSPGSQSATVGTAVSLQLTGTDSGGATVSFSGAGLPAGLQISSSGLITGTPTTAGSSTVTITGTDTTGASGQTSFTSTVSPPPAAPAATPNIVTPAGPGNQTTIAGTAVSLQLTGTDSGGAPLTFSATALPAGLSISAGGLITGTPTSPGTTSVTIRATDATGGSGQTTFSWTVAAVAAACTSAQLLRNPSFEAGSSGWSVAGRVIADNRQAAGAEVAHSGSAFAWLGGSRAPRGTVSQTIRVPAACHTATLSFWRHIDTTERRSKGAVDRLTVKLFGGGGRVLATLASYSNLDASSGYRRASFSLVGFAGQTVTLRFSASDANRGGRATDFCIDDTALVS